MSRAPSSNVRAPVAAVSGAFVTANASAASTQSDKTPVTRLGLLRNRPLMTLMLGHYTVDMYSGIIPFLYPLLTEKFHLSLGTVGFVSLA